MKVIERKEWQVAFTCKGCGSQIEAEMGDVKYTNYEDCPVEYFVECEVCGTPFKLKSSELPPKVANSARQRR